MAIATSINFCSNDFRFLARAVEETLQFSRTVLIPVCDHFFDGSPENRPLLERAYSEHLECTFIEFAYDVKRLYTPFIDYFPEDEEWGPLWHSTARYLAFLYLPEEIEYLLFLDADEIVEGSRFREWLEKEEWKKWDAHWFFSYCYGLDASKRAPHLQHTGLLVRRGALSPLKILNAQERFGVFAWLPGPKRLQVCGVDEIPMFHHYSWVRPQSERLTKARTWGKKHHCDWQEWIRKSEAEMRNYEDVSPYFNPFQVTWADRESERREFPNVIRTNRDMAFRKELEALYCS
jgi:hypothetical protein